MTRMTRAVTPVDLANVLSSAKVVVVAWNRDGQVAAELARLSFEEGRYRFGVPDRALVVRLATISERGAPLLTPLWFGRDGDVIYIGTRHGSPRSGIFRRTPAS